jgi:hypothetical protein
MVDMRLWWLHCRGSQNQFRYYWDAGSKNWADYHTKHHPDTYHEAHRITHAGIREHGVSDGHLKNARHLKNSDGHLKNARHLKNSDGHL